MINTNTLISSANLMVDFAMRGHTGTAEMKSEIQGRSMSNESEKLSSVSTAPKMTHKK